MAESFADGSLTVSADRLFTIEFGKIHNIEPNINLTNEPFRNTFNGVRRALRFLKTPDDIVLFYCKQADITEDLKLLLDVPTSIVIPFLSKFKTLLHNNADFIPKFRFYMDIGNLAGYPKMVDREQTDDPMLWLSTPTESQYSEDWWRVAFEKSYLSSAAPRRQPTLTYRQYVLNRWMWSTDGATKYGKATLDGDIVKTKFSAAISLSDEELLEHAYLQREEEYEIGIFIKPDEMGFKRRLIANVSLGPYILASYIRYIIEQNVSSSPLFLKLKLSPADKIDVVDLLKNRHVMLPLDESAYDYHVSRESWLGFISFLTAYFPNTEAVRLFANYFDRAYWTEEGVEHQWVSGMPSGLALTSFLNSWMNYIKQTTIVPGQLAYAAGDDVATAPFLPIPLEEISSKYAQFGSSINATKNWYSSKYCEYLKTIYHTVGTTGYPARIYASLIWAGQERSFLPSDKLPELAELFKQFFDRLGKPFDDNLVASDLSRSVSHKVKGFNTTMAKKWLYSPKVYGGFGKLPYNEQVFDWEVEILKRKQWANVVVRVPEINFYSTIVNLKTYTRAYSTGKSVYAGPPLRLPLVTTMQEWEARLNGDDNPIKGPFGKMAFDVIPLPTVDRVSTQNMSAFASHFAINVFPQLRGSTKTIQDRLICASLVLAKLVEEFMENHDCIEFAN